MHSITPGIGVLEQSTPPAGKPAGTTALSEVVFTKNVILHSPLCQRDILFFGLSPFHSIAPNEGGKGVGGLNK